MKASVPLPDSLREFIASCRWIFAKSYARDWPHEYIVREKVDEVLFIKLVEHIRAHGYEGRYYAKSITYFDEGGMVYWTMGSSLDETIIVNRCKKEQTYEYRLKHGTLPSPSKGKAAKPELITSPPHLEINRDRSKQAETWDWKLLDKDGELISNGSSSSKTQAHDDAIAWFLSKGVTVPKAPKIKR